MNWSHQKYWPHMIFNTIIGNGQHWTWSFWTGQSTGLSVVIIPCHWIHWNAYGYGYEKTYLCTNDNHWNITYDGIFCHPQMEMFGSLLKNNGDDYFSIDDWGWLYTYINGPIILMMMPSYMFRETTEARPAPGPGEREARSRDGFGKADSLCAPGMYRRLYIYIQYIYTYMYRVISVYI